LEYNIIEIQITIAIKYEWKIQMIPRNYNTNKFQILNNQQIFKFFNQIMLKPSAEHEVTEEKAASDEFNND